MATVEEMRAAVDAALASDADLVDWECDGCHKTTFVGDDPDGQSKPSGWVERFNEKTSLYEHFCNECQFFESKEVKP